MPTPSPILSLTDAAAALAGEHRDDLVKDIEPVDNLLGGMSTVLDPLRNLSDEERSTGYRGVAYGLVHGVLDMSAPAATSAGSAKGAPQDALNQGAFDNAVSQTYAWLAEVPSRKSDVLLRIALDGGDGSVTLNLIYRALCNQTYDSKHIDSHPELPMGKPTA
jgi:hypothetical protein